MKKVIKAGVVLALAHTTVAHAQQASYRPVPQVVSAREQIKYFPMGTPLTLITTVPLSTKVSKPGERVDLYVAQALSYRGQIVIPMGVTAIGEVGQADRNGHFGKKGKLAIRVLYIDTPNGQVRLSGDMRDEGTSGLVTSLATIAFVSPLGFLVHGTSANLPSGIFVQAYLGEDLRFREQPVVQAALNR